MDAATLLKKAMEAVREAGVPPELQETALKEAIAFLRDSSATATPRARTRANDAQMSPAKTPSKKSTAQPRKKSARSRAKPGSNPTAEATASPVADEDVFYSRLAEESGMDEKRLRAALHVTAGVVHISPPNRKLGASAAERARNVIALIAGARHGGLGESRVSTALVRAECERKGCYQKNNFAFRHLGPMNGFNALGQNEIGVNTKWLPEFEAALDQVLRESDNAKGA